MSEQDDANVVDMSEVHKDTAAEDDAVKNNNTSNKRKSRPGRATRRRNRKVRAIQEAEAALFGTGGGSGTAAVVDAASIARRLEDGDNDEGGDSTNKYAIPSDRHRSLPGVMQRRRDLFVKASSKKAIPDSTEDSEKISLEQLQSGDERLLTSQLGFIPGNAVCVAARVQDCEHLKLLESFGDSNNLDADATRERGNNLSPPTVLKLYPLAIRDACAKKKYKSRQRGQIVSSGDNIKEDSTDKDDETTSNNSGQQQQQKKKKKPARDWSVDIDGSSSIIEPFPTLYWLTDPRLRTLISKLEISDDLDVKRMEARVKSNPEYLASMERAHRAYGHTRWDLLTNEDQKAVQERGWDGAIGPSKGVAGVRDPKGVKCLHAHAAHYLAGGADNIVGKWTIEEVGRMLQERMGMADGENKS